MVFSSVFIALGLLNSAAQGFVLVDPTLTFQNEFSFSVATNMISSASVDYSGIVQSHYDSIVQIYGKDATDRIIQEVSYMAKNSDYRSEKWTLQIDRDNGVLEVFVLIAHVGSDSIKFSGGRGIITQPIPPVFDTKQVCARTGNRKYGIAGPRTEECHTITIGRGLNSYEIDLVQKNLMNYAISAENQLTGRIQQRITN
jgi:hypothetical protein